MEANQTFTIRLEQALLVKTGQMDKQELNQLKEDFKLFHTAYQGIYTILLRKGLIHEDPYKYDLKISEVACPPDQPFTESEKFDQMCIRLSQFESYLDFLNNYYQFSVEFLSMNRVKRLTALTKYFSFTSFTETSTNLNTKFLAELVGQIRKGSDPLVTGIINESLSQLDRTSQKIFQTLKELGTIHRERYKLEMRKLVTDGMAFNRDFAITHQDDTIQKIKSRFTELAAGKPFYPDLVAEVLKEDYALDSQILCDELIRRLQVKEQQTSKKQIDRDFRILLLEGSRIILGIGFQLDDAIHKLQENQVLMDAQDHSFATKLRRLLREMFGRRSTDIIHELDYLDPITSERKNETINFVQFALEVSKKAQNFMTMTSRTSAAYKRLEATSEDQAYRFLTKTIEELKLIHRRLIALDEFYKVTIKAPEVRIKVRSIKNELGSIKNAIIKANQKRHEFIAGKEEQEQMKRLGIKDA